MLPQRRGWACLLILWSSTVILGLGSGVSAAFPVSKNPVRISSEKPADYGEDEKEIALLTLREWGLGSFRLFAELAEDGVTAEGIMADPSKYSALLVVVKGHTVPQRRNVSAGQPFLEVEQGSVFGPELGLADQLPVQAINAGAAVLEKALSRPLFPIRMVPRQFAWSFTQERKPSFIYDVSEGLVYVDRSIKHMLRLPHAQAASMVEGFAQQLFERMAGLNKDDGKEEGAMGTAKLVAGAGAGALAAVMAAQIPLWFCIICPIVLGLLAPFVFNLGFGAVAEAVCEHYQLPAEDCNDLWYGAFALAMILSLAAAIPIVFVCKLPECAKGNPLPVWGRASRFTD